VSRENAKLALSIIYLQGTIIIWTIFLIPYLVMSVFAFIELIQIQYYLAIFISVIRNILFLIGSILLVPSSILYLLSCLKNKNLANPAFGLGVPAWFLILISFGLSDQSWSFYYLIVPAFLMIPIMLFGVILFSESKIIVPKNKSKRPPLMYNSSPKVSTKHSYRDNVLSQTYYNSQLSSSPNPNQTIENKKFKFCPECGAKLYFTDKFCVKCGHPQWLI